MAKNQPATKSAGEIVAAAAPMPARTLNPFGESRVVTTSSSNAADVSRAMTEVQAAMIVAKQFPRDKIAAMDRILNECTRLSLAESAIYSYPRGGTEVTGPSIRLAEVCAQNWGNFQFGWDVVSRGAEQSEILAFAWDVETNVRRTMKFFIRHWRDTKSGGYALKDERDIYELCANQAQRRVRSCILNTIPGDVIEAAVQQCEQTIAHQTPVTADSIKALVKAFEELGVSQEQIVKRIGRRLEVSAMNGALMAQLRKIFVGIRDGMSKPVDFFEPDTGAGEQEQAKPAGKSAGKAQPAQAEPESAGGAGAETGAPSTENADWDAFADELIAGLAGVGDEKALDALLDELQDEIGKLQSSGNRPAMQRWAQAVQRRRADFKPADKNGQGRLA